MKNVMIVVSLSAVAFAAGMLVSCSPVNDQAPISVPPVVSPPAGSYVNPAK